MNIDTSRKVIIRKSKYDSPEEAEAAHKRNLAKANAVYQSKSRFKEYRKNFRRQRILNNINEYVYDHCDEEHRKSMMGNFENIEDTFEIKKEFISIFNKEDYMKYIVN